MKRWSPYALGGLAVLGAVAWIALRVPAMDVWLFRTAVNRVVGAPDPRIAGRNELSVALCGTGTPLPDPTRAGPCTLIGAADDLYLVDVGIDSARNLLLWRVPLGKVEGIFITHLHSDHIGGLGEIRLQTWVAGRKAPLKIYGPPGIERVVAGFNEAYAIDSGYRTAHHGADFLPPAAADLVAVPVSLDDKATAIALESSGLTVTAIGVDHGPVKPAYGYRFDFAGRSVTLSGDTVPSDDLARGANHTDVLVHEALSPELAKIFEEATTQSGRARAAKIFHDIPGYHTSPIDAAKIANAAHARLLVFTHLLPIVPNAIAARAFLRGVSDVRPSGVTIGYDGLLLHLPGGTDRIEQDSLK